MLKTWNTKFNLSIWANANIKHGNYKQNLMHAWKIMICNDLIGFTLDILPLQYLQKGDLQWAHADQQ